MLGNLHVRFGVGVGVKLPGLRQHETVEGCAEVKEVIRGLDGIEAHLTAFRQKRQQQTIQRRLPQAQARSS